MENKKNEARKKQEDIALSRALIWFSAAMVLEFLLLLVNKYYVNFTADATSIALAQFTGAAVKVTTVLGLIGAVVCAFLGWKKAKAEQALPFLHLVIASALLTLGLGSGLIVLFYRTAVELLYILIPALAVLALVYYLYQRAFFFSTGITGIALLGLWMIRKNTGAHNLLVTVYAVLGAVVLLAILLLALTLKKKQGVLTIAGKEFSVLPKQSSGVSILLSCVLSLAALIAGLFLGSTAAFYLLFVLLAWLFVLLVYYTVKMM